LGEHKCVGAKRYW